MNLLHTSTKLTAGFILLILTTKIMGRQQLSQVSLFDFISAMVLGEIIGNALYDPDTGLGFVIVNLTLWTGLKLFIEWLTLKSTKIRTVLDGKPSILIRHGQIDIKELRKNHLNIHKLLLMIREWEIFSLAEVEYAIFETDGRLSVMKKPGFQTPTIQDLNLPHPTNQLPATVIIDGEILQENLHLCGIEEQWLITELRKQGYYDPARIIYAEYLGNQQLFIMEEHHY